MSGHYLIRIESWPYSGIVQELAGPREQAFLVPAQDIKEALALAELFRDGMLTNPHVWQAPIKEIRQARRDEHARFERPCVTSTTAARNATPTPTPGGLAEGER